MSKEELDTLFAERLSELIHNSNYNLSDMEEAVGKTAATISRYATGEITGVKRSTIVKIANFFKVNPAWLAGLSDNKYIERVNELGSPVTSIPILGIVKAGYNYLAQENVIGTIDVEKSLVGNGDDYFALEIKGDSMFPVLIENDIVLIKKQDDFDNGDIVVALINGDEATIKKGKKSDAGIFLQPLNTSYEPLIFTYAEMETIPVKIIGVVKQLKRKF